MKNSETVLMSGVGRKASPLREAETVKRQVVKRWQRKLTDLFREQNQVILGGMTTEDVCRPILQSAVDRFGFRLAHVWSVDPRRKKLILVGQVPNFGIDKNIAAVIDVETSFSGEPVETRRPQIFNDLETPRGIRRFQNPRLLNAQSPIRSMLSVPIRNIGNPYQVLFVIDLFSDRTLPEWILQETFLTELRPYTNLLASLIESNLRERAFRMSTKVSQDFGRLGHEVVRKACETFADSIRVALSSDWVSVYLEDWTHERLTRKGDSGMKSAPPDSADPVPVKVTQVWETNREFLAPELSLESKPEDLLEAPVNPWPQSVLLIPLHDVRGRCKGVVRCTSFAHRNQRQWRRSHSYDDIAVVEAMGNAFAPLLEMLLESEQRENSLQKLAHEIRVPIVALRAVLHRMEREYDASAFRFRYPHFNEANTYIEIMKRLAKELDIVRVGPDRIPLKIEETKLHADVIVPARRFIEPVLRDRGFTSRQLSDSGFETVPKLPIDAALITQVIFNLLENAIKYFPLDRPSSDFRCEISCHIIYNNRLEISIIDNGRGISLEDEARIFQFGVRGKTAHESNVEGSGLGLWLSRQIARRHQGDLVLRSRCDPTVFVLTFPHTARKPWPYYFN